VNPPGDTRDVAHVLTDVLGDNGVPYEVIAPEERMPNVVAQFDGKARGDGPTSYSTATSTPMRSANATGRSVTRLGRRRGRKVFGRDVSDMHGGFVATLAATVYLFERRNQFAGRVTLAGISDEETGSRWGTEYPVENHPEYTGDTVLNVDVRGQSAHSALLTGTNAVEALIEFLHDLRVDDSFAALVDVPDAVRTPVEAGQEEMDSHCGASATEFPLTPSMNVGTLEGGGTVNLTAERAHVEVDLRLPVGTATADALA
jgi:acetylornithine deacetylase/succinyl-diaminopimelate desuccinylase-like protein